MLLWGTYTEQGSGGVRPAWDGVEVMEAEKDTIVAIATAPGRGGIGVVRLSGGRAREIAGPMLRLRIPMEAGRAQFGYLLDRADLEGGDGAVLDEVVVTNFAAPRSYTGEDVVEIAAHGAPVLLDAMVRGCLRRGARLAEPGEFTQRAFLSGRLDLVQAEAVNDLIQSSTLHQARTAARQMGGAVSREVAPSKELLLELIATLEAGIDFAEDDIDVMAGEEILRRIGEVETPLRELERSYGYGRLVRDGFRLAIVGRPNAGKSSLFNALVERPRAIVTAAPGTTRDLVTETIALGGVPVELTDTAGLRTGETGGGALDEAEVLGISRSRQAMLDADVVLLVIDGTAELHAEDVAVIEGDGNGNGAGGRLLVALNKSDLFADGGTAVGEIGRRSEVVETSTVTGAGLPALRAAILAIVRGGSATREGGLLTNLRQHGAVAAALAAVRDAAAAVGAGLPHEVFVLDLHRSLRNLDELTGATTSDDILCRIFSTFCIGK